LAISLLVISQIDFVMAKKKDLSVETVSGFKAFNSDMKCRDFQFVVGQTYTYKGNVSLCKSGFHFCEDPLHVLAYYPPDSRFCRVSATGVSSENEENNSKRVAQSITIGEEMLLSQLIEESVKYRLAKAGDAVVRNFQHSGAATASGDRGAATASGDSGAATASGDRGAATASGYSGAATASGDSGAATASGDRGAATASGYRGAATASGDSGAATASGDRGAATASGDRGAATASGEESCAISIGIEGKAKASLGSWITLSEWKQDASYAWHRIDVRTVKVDGAIIKAATWYSLKDGKFVEVA
jgi:hypothetical protein